MGDVVLRGWGRERVREREEESEEAKKLKDIVVYCSIVITSYHNGSTFGLL